MSLLSNDYTDLMVKKLFLKLENHFCDDYLKRGVILIRVKEVFT